MSLEVVSIFVFAGWLYLFSGVASVYVHMYGLVHLGIFRYGYPVLSTMAQGLGIVCPKSHYSIIAIECVVLRRGNAHDMIVEHLGA